MAATNDGMLLEWGARLFYSMPKKGKKPKSEPSFSGSAGPSVGEIRNRVRQVVNPRAKQVIVKITGGGKGMAPIAAHFRYIGRQGKPEVGGRGKSLEIEDQDGNILSGRDDIKDLEADWRVSGSYIGDTAKRKEAFNIVLSMPSGTPPEHVLSAAREFAHNHFDGHKFVFVMHNDTDAPHVHLAVKAERWDGHRLNPRKADLQIWRQSFARSLQDRGVDAIATRAASRNQSIAPQAIWRVKTKVQIRKPRPAERSSESVVRGREQMLASWKGLAEALANSSEPSDHALATEVQRYVGETFGRAAGATPTQDRTQKPGLKPA